MSVYNVVLAAVRDLNDIISLFLLPSRYL